MELSAPLSPQAHLKESACFLNRSRSCVFYNNAFGAAAAIGLRTLTICQLFSKNANLIGIHATAIFCKSAYKEMLLQMKPLQRHWCSIANGPRHCSERPSCASRRGAVAGDFLSKHIGCVVLLGGFTSLENTHEKLKILCFV